MSVALNEVLTLSVKGRACREAYWLSLFVALVLYSLAGLLWGVAAVAGGAGLILQSVAAVLMLAVTVFTVAAVVRRLHDISYSGVAALFMLVPGVQIIVMVILGLVPGKKGLNRFGPDPLAIMTIDDSVPSANPAPARIYPAPAARAAQAAAAAGSEAAAVKASEPDPLDVPVREVRETPEAEVLDAPAGDDAYDAAPHEDTPADLYEKAAFLTKNESLSVRIQVKCRYVEKLRKLLAKGRISQQEYELWKRRIMQLK
ncbi:MAG: hypothetical protein ACFWTZ_00870 [Burkholderia sp.]|jgi:uncharacterized membrane protein YhaH (DUF805 family)